MVRVRVRVRVYQMWVNILLVVVVVEAVIVAVICGGGTGFLGTRRNFLVFPATTTHRDVTKSATFCPVPAAGFAEITRLG